MRSIIKFIIIVIPATWLCWIPGLLVSQFSVDLPEAVYLTLATIGTWVPSIVGLVFLKRSKRRFRELFSLKLGWWWIPTLLILPLGAVVAQVASVLFHGASFQGPTNYLLLPAQFIGALILTGPLGEEIGWRGYCLPELQKKFGALTSSIILGLIWVIWHVPAFFIEAAPQSKLPFIPFSITLLTVSVLITWIQNNTKQSVWPALIIHSATNLSAEVFKLIDLETGNYQPWIYANYALILFTAAIVVTFGAKTLSKKHMPA